MKKLKFKPMKASPAELDTLSWPRFGSPKIDGIRGSVVGGKLLSAQLEVIPNRFVSAALSRPEFEGLDGELIVGEPTSKTCYRDSVSAIMTHDGEPNFSFHVFDLWNSPSPFSSRVLDLRAHVESTDDARIRLVVHTELRARIELDAYEEAQLSLGYEGVMLSCPYSFYKFGRATALGGELLKVKRFVDAEAEVIGIEEEMFNGNAAVTNELGRTKRSTAKAGLVGKGTMGALIVRDLITGVEFKIGTGFTAADRAAKWKLGEIVKYKSFPVGVKKKPRHPVFLGRRPKGA